MQFASLPQSLLTISIHVNCQCLGIFLQLPLWSKNVTNFSPLVLGRFLRFWRFCGNIFSRSRIFRWQKNQAFCYAPAQFGTNFGCLLYSIPLFHRLVFYFRETRHFREKRGGVQQVVHVGEICFFGAQKKNTQYTWFANWWTAQRLLLGKSFRRGPAILPKIVGMSSF